MERVCDGAGEDGGEVDDHAVDADIGVGGNERRGLGAVDRLVEWPCALAGALIGGITDPEVRESDRSGTVWVGGGGGMGGAAGGAKALDGDVGGSEDRGDGGAVGSAGGESEEIGGGEGFTERETIVDELRAEGEGDRAAAVGAGGGPPGGDGWGGDRGRGGEGEDEVGDGGAVGGGEGAVPKKAYSEVAGEERTVVVLEDERLLLDQDKLASGCGCGCGAVEEEREEEEEKRSHWRRESEMEKKEGVVFI